MRRLVCVMVFAACLHFTLSGLLQPTQNASERWSRVSHKYQRLHKASYYSVHQELETWFTASNICSSEGAHLLIINSEDEANVVKNILDPSVETYSIGFHDLFGQGQYRTVQCQSLLEAGYYQWALFEPTSFAGEDCGGVNHEALLYDVDCSNPQPFICEYEP